MTHTTPEQIAADIVAQYETTPNLERQIAKAIREYGGEEYERGVIQGANAACIVMRQMKEREGA